MSDTKKAIWLLIINLPMLIIGWIMKGWVVVTLYEWFVMPTFKTPSISIPIAIGICYLISYIFLTEKTIAERSEFNKKQQEGKTLARLIGENIGSNIGVPLVILLFAYIIQLFI